MRIINKVDKEMIYNQSHKSKYKDFIIYFYIYSFLGWIIDVLIVLISDGKLENRGFLIEPICPIYGFSALILLIILSNYKKDNFSNFIRAMVICTIFEYFTSLIFEIVFHIRWWDYSKEYFNINGRVCLAASIFWGILSNIFIREIHPFIKKKLKKILIKIKDEYKETILKLLVFTTMIDFLISTVNYIIIH